VYVSAGGAEQGVVGVWGRSNLGRVAALYPSGVERATSRTCKKRTNGNAIADPLLNQRKEPVGTAILSLPLY
jgi:hypothetical protein